MPSCYSILLASAGKGGFWPRSSICATAGGDGALAKRVEKLRKHEECARELLEALEAKLSQASQQPREQLLATSPKEQKPVRRALRKKSPAAQVEASSSGQEKSSASGARVGNPFDGTDDDGFVNHDVTHKYKLVEVRTRRYANSHSTQNSGTAWQATALDQNSRP